MGEIQKVRSKLFESSQLNDVPLDHIHREELTLDYLEEIIGESRKVISSLLDNPISEGSKLKARIYLEGLE